MSVFSDNQGLVLPDEDDGNNVPLHLENYNDGVESRLVQRYSSSADRGVRNAAPVKGELSYLGDADRYERYDGTQWRPLMRGATHPLLPGESNTRLVSFTGASYWVTVTFTTPFAVRPRVFTNINSAAGSTARWDSRAYAITTTQFNLFLFSNDGSSDTFSNLEVDWLAVAQS